jgi:hypothetical protein
VTSAVGRISALVIVPLALLVGGCGGGSTSTATSSSHSAGSATTQATTTTQPAAAPAARLAILSPRSGSHTGPTVAVRVGVSGAAPAGEQRFRYVLDRKLTRTGSSRLTFHEVAPGRHHLDVVLIGSTARRTTATFTVRTPVKAAVNMPATVPTTATPAPAPTTATRSETATHTTPPPPPTHTTTPPPPPTHTTTPSESGGGIPQGANAGDGDGDNSGAPSDGDGNI